MYSTLSPPLKGGGVAGVVGSTLLNTLLAPSPRLYTPTHMAHLISLFPYSREGGGEGRVEEKIGQLVPPGYNCGGRMTAMERGKM